MLSAIASFFNSDNFMPHGHCFLWQPDIFWLHTLSDAGIASAYFAIPFTMIYVLQRRKDLPFENVFLLFAAFILLCGATHLMSIWVLWHPDYALEGVLKAMAAMASIATFFVTLKLIPRILSIPSPMQLAAVNSKLQETTRQLEILYRQSKATAESHLQVIVNTVHDGLITVDGQGALLTFNPAASHIFGYTAEEALGKNLTLLLPAGEAKVSGGPVELQARRKDGSEFPVEMDMNEIRFDGAPMFVGSIRDITGRKEAERKIEHHVKALKRSNQELDDFAYIASHDLKEPLRGLSNNAMFLKEDYEDKLDAGGIKRLDRMEYLCARLERLVNDLHYFSVLGRQDMAIQETDLNGIIKDIGWMMEGTLQEARATIAIPVPLPVITCDLPRITEVFRNLITNAAKYSDKPETRIEIGCELHGSERVFYVKDNGIGIATENYHDVFRMFKRLNDEEDHVKGTGVGLTFVKKILERHGGRIWIDSQLGSGTTFYFTLNDAKETL